MSIMLQRKPTPLPAWHLTDAAAMVEALGDLSGQGWRGAISSPSSDEWRLELNADGPTRQVIAATGEWLILDGELRKLSDEERTAGYDEVTE